jgi:isocitrate dehydrogenase
MAGGKSKIIYTLTDEAPLLATCAFLPIIRTFTGPAGIEIEKADISVSARVLSEFSDFLTDEQKVPNTLGELGKKCLLPDTNIIKLPNISASVAQLKACVKELQEKGYAIPDYPETANTDEEKALKARFGKCLGSAVNPLYGVKLRRHVHDLATINLGHPHHFITRSTRTTGFDQHHFTLNMRTIGDISDLQYINQFVQLLGDLFNDLNFTAGHNGHARQSGIFGRGYR